MSPIVFLVVGLLIVWLIFTGRATNVWNAITNAAPTGNGNGGAGGGGSRGFL